MTKEVIRIGIAEFKIAKAPVSLISTGLGSCLGVCLWDPLRKIGGVVHIMLPNSKAARSGQLHNPAKYADTGIQILRAELIKNGAKDYRLVAKIAGGAQMFSFQHLQLASGIGEQNIKAVKKVLEDHKIKLLAEDVGGNHGRTIEFFTKDGQLLIRSIRKGVKII